MYLIAVNKFKCWHKQKDCSATACPILFTAYCCFNIKKVCIGFSKNASASPTYPALTRKTKLCKYFTCGDRQLYACWGKSPPFRLSFLPMSAVISDSRGGLDKFVTHISSSTRFNQWGVTYFVCNMGSLFKLNYWIKYICILYRSLSI